MKRRGGLRFGRICESALGWDCMKEWKNLYVWTKLNRAMYSPPMRLIHEVVLEFDPSMSKALLCARLAPRLP
jgi:hypothetical protein